MTIDMEALNKMADKTLGKITEGDTRMAIFKKKEIRSVFHNNEWFYSVIDVIEAVVGSDRSRKYCPDLKKQIIEKEEFTQLSEKIVQLKMKASDGKKYLTDAADVETLFRITQSIPSKRAEAIKRWLAKVGYERIQEIQNPEIGIKRSIAQYKVNGRSDEWIKSRVKSIITRKELTDEWEKRGIQGGQYGGLTNAISKGAFDITTSEHKEIKSLKGQNLRDHMSTLELAIMNLGEAASAEFTKSRDAQGYEPNLEAAQDGGNVAGKARKDIEGKTGKKIVTSQNYLERNKNLTEE